MRAETYVKDTFTVERLTMGAVLVSKGAKKAWVARSLIHAADDMRLSDTKNGDEMSIRILDWKMEQVYKAIDDA